MRILMFTTVWLSVTIPKDLEAGKAKLGLQAKSLPTRQTSWGCTVVLAAPPGSNPSSNHPGPVIHSHHSKRNFPRHQLYPAGMHAHTFFEESHFHFGQSTNVSKLKWVYTCSSIGSRSALAKALPRRLRQGSLSVRQLQRHQLTAHHRPTAVDSQPLLLLTGSAYRPWKRPPLPTPRLRLQRSSSSLESRLLTILSKTV